jgi:hypothetical protein
VGSEAEPGSIEEAMSFWVILLVLGLVKVSIVALMLWIPFRRDDAMNARDDPARVDDGSDDDGPGGLRVQPAPSGPHPRLPRPSGGRMRGPHGAPGPSWRLRRGDAARQPDPDRGQRLRLR